MRKIQLSLYYPRNETHWWQELTSRDVFLSLMLAPKDILMRLMLSYAQTTPQGWFYQMENDPKYRCKRVVNWFQVNHVHVLLWSNQSPDLNPTDHL